MGISWSSGWFCQYSSKMNIGNNNTESVGRNNKTQDQEQPEFQSVLCGKHQLPAGEGQHPRTGLHRIPLFLPESITHTPLRHLPPGLKTLPQRRGTLQSKLFGTTQGCSRRGSKNNSLVSAMGMIMIIIHLELEGPYGSSSLALSKRPS